MAEGPYATVGVGLNVQVVQAEDPQASQIPLRVPGNALTPVGALIPSRPLRMPGGQLRHGRMESLTALARVEGYPRFKGALEFLENWGRPPRSQLGYFR
jgi:hypothetical protein